MLQFERLGIFLSKPIAFLFVFIYLLQSGLLVYLIIDKIELEKQIAYQQERVSELEEKLQIFKAINDFQIGFTDEETYRLANVIYDESFKYEYDPMFVIAIILTESSFVRGQTSNKGARGLMQVIPYVGRDLAERSGVEWEGTKTLFEAETNIKLGTLHMFEQILKFGDIKKAILSYNLGETRLRGLIRQQKELPKQYLNKVLENYRMLKDTYSA